MGSKTRKSWSGSATSQSPGNAGLPATASSERTPEQSLTTKERRLPVRGKGVAYKGHKSISAEVPVSQLPKQSELVRQTGDNQQEDRDDDVTGTEDIYKTPREKKHTIFEEDSHDEFVTPLERPVEKSSSSVAPRPHTQPESLKEKDEEDGDEEDDDDDAPPEAVSSHNAATQSLKREHAAAKAAELQAAAKKRKRQERDAFFKKQAEERKRAVEGVGKGEALEPAVAEVREPLPEAHRKRSGIPQLLPLELLESDDEEDMTKPESSTERGAKKVKLDATELSQEGRPPRDQRVGSTVYRVLSDNGDRKMAPTGGKHARIVRENMMLRKRTPSRRGGFFVKA